MITKTDYTVDLSLIQEALVQLPNIEFRLAINQPTGNFFYDEWKLKDEFLGTIWEEIYNSLPVIKGEARIIKLEGSECYASHADIDDRYHLNLSGTHSYLIDLDSSNMFKIQADGNWYNMNAGLRHSAANFGDSTRYQLVVRHLLSKNSLQDPVSVKIISTEHDGRERFIFDDTLSPWLNIANKQSKISNFKFVNDEVLFNVDRIYLSELTSIIPDQLKMIVI